MEVISKVNELIKSLKAAGFDENKISDGWHTFDDLYDIRKAYNAALFNEWAAGWRSMQRYKGSSNPELKIAYENSNAKYHAHKSWKHHDGELCFGGGWFIVSAMLPSGLISNHYKESDWDMFQIPEVEKAIYPFDGHTTHDVISRLNSLAECPK